ncbi:MAG TPA: DUF3106 domain-containing protein [Luteimonas sp.]|nr:DUF3106 domain-containing protein [Luteimonas sp.]
MRALPILALATAVAVAALLPRNAFASPPQEAQPAAAASLPAWDQLTPAQREMLVAPVRERWNDNPGARARMYEHARRWQTMTPEQRKRARHGMQRWRHMDPEQRAQARALFDRMRGMTPEQRQVLRDQWKAMTPQQRREWVERNPPRER